MKRKRVEYQKYIRTKLEQERYRELFGMTDNITLEGEEDLVLQREFRIDFDTQATQSKDFVLQTPTDAPEGLPQKICAAIPIIGIFSHFKHYNILEFKSYNDPLTTILLTKYIGQLFWWFRYASLGLSSEAYRNLLNPRLNEFPIEREYYDVSAPSNPTKLGYIALPDLAKGVYVEGSLAYVAKEL